MSHLLIIFDHSLKIERIEFDTFKNVDKVYLFPLTSKLSFINELLETIKAKIQNVEVIDTGKLINSVSESLRANYLKFIAQTPLKNFKKQKNLKEIFAVNNDVTLWWFSQLAEKSPYKSNSFNDLVQMESIVEVLEERKINKIQCGVKNNNLKRSLRSYSKKSNIDFKELSIKSERTFKSWVLYDDDLAYIKNILILFRAALSFLLTTRKIKKDFKNITRRIPSQDSLLFISFYPIINIPMAKKGIFKNKHYAFLQESLEEKKKDIFWTCMYVRNNQIPLSDSFNYAKEFIKNGQNIVFLNEFVSLSDQIRSMFIMLSTGLKFKFLENRIRKAHTFGKYNFYQLFKKDWYMSFAGSVGYQGLLYYYMFYNLLGRFKFSKCFYPCENHLWEKALIYAKNAKNVSIPFYTYQPGTVTKMSLNYFSDPLEINTLDSYPFPQPDKILVNGNIPYRFMLESGWEKNKIMIVEAIRYYYLREYLHQNIEKTKKIVLVGLSIDPEESASLLSMTYESLKNIKDIEVWIKPHPFLSIDLAFETAGIDKSECTFKIKIGPIEDFLKEARLLIVGESGISIESLAFGCEVIYVNVPEFINMSTVKGIQSDIIHLANNPLELSKIILEIFSKEYNPGELRKESIRIINDFFYLDFSSDHPEKLLSLLNSE
jgi:surface carbohydrate biosynthesis protein (TIGR04326 family)